MAFDLLIQRIDERLHALKLSERKACLAAEIGLNSIRHIRKRGHAPKPETLIKLAAVLQVPALYLLEAAGSANENPTTIALEPIFVRGAVQAGAWREAIEWEGNDWYQITVPTNARFPDVPRFGLEVRGRSMDRLYPDGTIVIVVRYGDLGRLPRAGEKIVVLRRSRKSDEYEATLKEYEIDAEGRHILWPRSTDPDFQAPFILPNGELPIAEVGIETTTHVSAGGFPADGGEPDVLIVGLVVGSYRPE